MVYCLVNRNAATSFYCLYFRNDFLKLKKRFFYNGKFQIHVKIETMWWEGVGFPSGLVVKNPHFQYRVWF